MTTPTSILSNVQSSASTLNTTMVTTAGQVLVARGTDGVFSPATDSGPVLSVNGATGAVVLTINDVAPTQTSNAAKVLTTNGTVTTWQALPVTITAGALVSTGLTKASITGATEQTQIDSIVAALVLLGLATDNR